MALTDNRTLLNDCEDDANGFSTTGAQLGFTILAGQFIEGAASIETQHSDVYDDTFTNADSGDTAFDIDLSDQTVYMGIKDNLFDEVANAGAMIVLGDGTDRIGYTVGGRDAVGMPYANQYAIFKLDGSDAAANPGTVDVDHHLFAGVEADLAFANITIVGWGTLHGSKAQGAIPNVFIDNIRHIANDSIAASIIGGTVGTPETMADVVGDDETVGAGMFANPLGSQFIIFAPTEWGDTAAVDSFFEGIDEQWYFLGDNAGSRAVGATHFPMQVVGNSGQTNSFELTRVVMVNTGVRSAFDLSSTDVDTLNLTAVSFDAFAAITFPPNSATKDMADLTFNDCDQVYFDDVDVNGATFNGTTDAGGAVLWDDGVDPSNQDNITFNTDGSGHAIDIDLNTASLTTFNIDGYTFDGYDGDGGTAADRVFLIDNALDGDVTINLTNSVALNVQGGGSGFSHEIAAGYTGTVLILNTVTLTVQVDDSDGNPVEGASVRIELVSDGSEVAQGTTNASGTFTDSSFNFSTDTDVLTKVRLKGFKNFRAGGTIISTGLTVGVTFQTDNIVDLP